ncbi:MAG: hypothetical protein ACI3XG_05940 [Faecousia sp.]
MKRIAIVCTLFVCLMLSACGNQLPEKTAEGEAWGEDWTTLGSFLGVEPMDGWTVQRNEDVLAAEGTFYASWTQGEATTYSNENGDEITTYDAQIHLVVMELETSADAEETAAQWQLLASERYTDTEESTAQYAGQSFQISAYPFPEGSGPASLGASATGIRGNRAIRVDVVTLEGFSQEPWSVLADFLEHCHYAE